MDHVWLNTAHQGILPQVAAEAAEQAIAWKRQSWELTSTRFAEVPARLREALAALLSVPASEIVLADSDSYGLHLIANGCPWQDGEEVLLVRSDFPSTILPWLGLARRGVKVQGMEDLRFPGRRVDLHTSRVHALR